MPITTFSHLKKKKENENEISNVFNSKSALLILGQRAAPLVGRVRKISAGPGRRRRRRRRGRRKKKTKTE